TRLVKDDGAVGERGELPVLLVRDDVVVRRETAEPGRQIERGSRQEHPVRIVVGECRSGTGKRERNRRDRQRDGDGENAAHCDPLPWSVTVMDGSDDQPRKSMPSRTDSGVN